MAYHHNLKEAFYTSPSGVETYFDYESLSRDITHRIGTFEFSGVDGTLHQDKGVSGEVYPLRIFIHGQNYDSYADRFLRSTKETGAGYLNHPRWGKRRVQIISISQRENLVRRGGQAVFNVVFQETLEREFPRTGAASQQQIKTQSDDCQEESVNNFAIQVT